MRDSPIDQYDQEQSYQEQIKSTINDMSNVFQYNERNRIDLDSDDSQLYEEQIQIVETKPESKITRLISSPNESITQHNSNNKLLHKINKQNNLENISTNRTQKILSKHIVSNQQQQILQNISKMKQNIKIQKQYNQNENQQKNQIIKKQKQQQKKILNKKQQQQQQLSTKNQIKQNINRKLFHQKNEEILEENHTLINPINSILTQNILKQHFNTLHKPQIIQGEISKQSISQSFMNEISSVKQKDQLENEEIINQPIKLNRKRRKIFLTSKNDFQSDKIIMKSLDVIQKMVGHQHCPINRSIEKKQIKNQNNKQIQHNIINMKLMIHEINLIMNINQLQENKRMVYLIEQLQLKSENILKNLKNYQNQLPYQIYHEIYQTCQQITTIIYISNKYKQLYSQLKILSCQIEGILSEKHINNRTNKITMIEKQLKDINQIQNILLQEQNKMQILIVWKNYIMQEKKQLIQLKLWLKNYLFQMK